MKPSRFLITGGAGFIGCNLADYFLRKGHQVTIFDNHSRKGVGNNLLWLRQRYQSDLAMVEGDIRNYEALLQAAEGAQVIYHTAGQTAVTMSVRDPRPDFEINALGTFNVLEAARQVGDHPLLVFTSTNKVYGGMEDLRIIERDTRYEFESQPGGIDETRPLDFHSPYGCSKGAADQYFRDYARIYGLDTVVFRMGAIYGPHQFGMEDQAWLAYFVIATTKGWPITIYGDGKQVRDVLFIDDLVRAFELATENREKTAGQIYNIGGGPGNTISIWEEFCPLLSELLNQPVQAAGKGDWRPGDQMVYVSDIRKAYRDFGWLPQIGVKEGLERITEWVMENREIFSH